MVFLDPRNFPEDAGPREIMRAKQNMLELHTMPQIKQLVQGQLS